MPGRQRPSRRPPTTDDEREQLLISKALDLAERQLEDGTASAQTINHFLKAGSSRERLEKERLRTDIELGQAKVKNLASQERVEEMYAAAMEAMRSYNDGRDTEWDEYEEYYDDY
jgi:hypothetical protein